ncbi:hypothetical protein SDC9_129661 [bioreactor metagenome]|uniref:Uncharacterized protein n=1 Tax=bioreactor metagenome TaxID=1076179 RepID=A0A645CZF9_9ZZZZ
MTDNERRHLCADGLGIHGETPCGNQGTPARKGGLSLEGEVDGRGCARRTKQPARRTAPQSRRSRLPGHAAGNASEHAASVRHMAAAVRLESATRRHRVPRKRRAPHGAQEGVTRRRRASVRPARARRHRTPTCERRRAQPGATLPRGTPACPWPGAPAAVLRR